VTIVNIGDVRLAAKRRLPKALFDFIDGAAEDEQTYRANREDFAKFKLRQRVLVDVSQRDLSTTVLGQKWNLPLIMAPTGLTGLFWRQGEVSVARAAAKAGIPYCLSTSGSVSIEDVAKAAPGHLWFQLYVMRDRALTHSLVDRAKAAGYRTLCVTVDLPMHGRRERDVYNGMSVPPRITLRNVTDMGRRIAWVRNVLMGPRVTMANFVNTGVAQNDIFTIAKFVNTQFDPSVTWTDLAELIRRWNGPVAVKGILTPEDARRALDAGAKVIIVSNHGGRQLDGTSSAIAALPGIVDAVEGQGDVILDGGIRRGRDIVKAVALGARACMIGRPYLYGVASAGEAGVDTVVDILRGEVDTTLGLMGTRSIRELNRDAIEFDPRLSN
jgi:L-lactate dehydrogenase (cytochrome)